MSQKEINPSGTTSSKSLLSSAATLLAILAVVLALSSSLRSVFPKSISKATSSFSSNLAKRTMTTTNGTNGHANGAANLKITKRPWNARGFADHGWLYSYHTFSFASYYDPDHAEFGPLRVINEDRVEKGTGFGTHSHAEFLIWSYMLEGELEHKDSMGNLEKLRRGEVQFTSAGTGIRHSEYNRNKEEDCHFLQVHTMKSPRHPYSARC